VRLFALTAVSVTALTGIAAAETYQASGVHIEHAAAVVNVIPESRSNVDVAITPGNRLPTPEVRVDGARVVIDGGLENRFRGCWSLNEGEGTVRIAGIGGVRREELPRITLRVPRELAFAASGAVFTTIGASSGGNVALTGCGDADVGATSGALRVVVSGSGDVEVDRVGGALTALLSGSGSADIARADGDATLHVTGSGDLRVGAVGGGADIQVTGSGEVRTGAIGRDAALVSTGSGDVTVGGVRGSLRATVTGSGAIDVTSVEGETVTLSSTSSGDIDVDGGRTGRLVARTNGSGNVNFGGAAGASELRLNGSGNIVVADAGRVERMTDNGSGSINIGR